MDANGGATWRSKASLQRLPIIIDLLYGFAIGNGLSDALRGAFVQHGPVALILLAAATIMAFSDWLAYHVHVSPIPYTSVWRLLLDMTFPMLIYLLLLSPTLAEEMGSGAYVSTVLLLYFAGAALWLHLLGVESIEPDPKLKSTIIFCASMALIAVAIGWLPIVAGSSPFGASAFYGLALLSDAISMAAIMAWSFYNIRCVQDTMKVDSH